VMRSPRPSRAHSTHGPVLTRVVGSSQGGGGGGSSSGSGSCGKSSFIVPAGRPTTAGSQEATSQIAPKAAAAAVTASVSSSAPVATGPLPSQERVGGVHRAVGPTAGHGSRGGATTKVAPRSNGTFGDVITVHSPRQAALIFDLLN
jgi:hypothetical protein